MATSSSRLDAGRRVRARYHPWQEPESERGCNADIYNDASPSLAVKLNAWAIQLPKHGRGRCVFWGLQEGAF
uniref:Uncharacterized protein n=1 Tax=Oryza glaberrima TaxID=4538 RepID=I1QCS1_ORYGL